MESPTDAYLIVAKYNRDKWNKLTSEEKGKAHHKAEEWIPENPKRVGNPKPQDVTGPSGKGSNTRIIQSFASSIFALQELPEYQALPDHVQEAVVDGIYAKKPPDPPVGWMEIVEAPGLPDFIRNMAPLWKMYDVEIFWLPANWTTSHKDVAALPKLNNDETTHEVYMYMTPRNWST